MKTPFVKLLNINQNFYFYDVNCNRIVKISSDSYSKLVDILKKEEFDFKELSDECKCYFNAGLLQSNQIISIKNNCEDILGLLNSNLQSLLLQITRDCNLRCKYCFYSGLYKGIRHHEKTHMSWEICKACVDFFIHRTSCEKVANIGFYGGEPLLNFDLIKKCVQYINEKYSGKKIQYGN